jgi:hypothetical protein
MLEIAPVGPPQIIPKTVHFATAHSPQILPYRLAFARLVPYGSRQSVS